MTGKGEFCYRRPVGTLELFAVDPDIVCAQLCAVLWYQSYYHCYWYVWFLLSRL